MKLSFPQHFALMALTHLHNRRVAHARLLRQARRNKEALSPSFWLLMVKRSERWLAENEARLETRIARLAGE